MIRRAYALSSTTEAFNAECAKLRSIFIRLDYSMSLIDSAINNFFFVMLQRTQQKETMIIVAQ